MRDHMLKARELTARMTLAEKLSQMRYDAPAIPRLGVPAYNWWNEALHGAARSGTATVFPQAIAMAASFDEALLREVGRAIGTEVRAKYNAYRRFGDTEIYEGLTCWSPNINIFRDPRWGRGHETYGEDPYLTGVMGSAFVNGLQGDDPDWHLTDATLKHFAAHSGPESGRHGFNAVVSERDLRETYLWAFRYCVEHAHPAAVMGAYNRLNGEPCCGSERLLGGVLRGEFGFDGYVLSDCGAICDINSGHHVTANEAESAALAVNAGCDLNCGSAYQWLKTSVALGLLDEETVTRSVERLFAARFRLGMFEPEACPYSAIPMSVVCCDAHRALNRRMAAESIVLCKNDGLLPLSLDTCKTVAVIGPNADERSILTANYAGVPDDYVTLLRGIREAGARVRCAKGVYSSAEEQHQGAPHGAIREALIAASQADAVILCMGLNPSYEGEEGAAGNAALNGDRADLELPAAQLELLEALAELGKPMVFVNVSGSAVNLSRPDALCGAVVQCFYPGAEGGHALADILFGRVSPSGRLPVTFYRSVSDLPPFENYSMEGRTYRFFKGEPLYRFGHGLSYGKITERWDGGEVTLTNSGADTAYTALKYEGGALCAIKRAFVRSGETVKL